MSARSEKDKTKQLQEKCQTVLNNLLKDEDNKYCVDCDSKGPRWASWNIGVFLCIRCAGIHRNLGVHISKVKSVNLDTWTPDQVVSLQQMGNSRARAVYEANLPDNFRRPQNDSSLESFIRAKYEHKKYIAHEWVPPPLPKVNWEKEIDEEMEKQRRKKKTVIEQTHLENVEVPQLPKPNPKPIPVITSDLATEKKQKKDDFLGLQNGEDSFSGFISASTSKTEEEIKTSAKNEEESFFNQIIPMEKQKTKLDKNSILALYSRNPTNNFQYSNAQPFHNPNFPYTQNNFQSATTFPPSQIVPHNNLLSTSAQWPSHTPSQWNQQNEYVKQSSQFLPNTTLPNLNQLTNNSTKFINMTQISSNQFLPKQTNSQNQVPTSFLGNHNLQQQFSSLTLNSQDINATFPSY